MIKPVTKGLPQPIRTHPAVCWACQTLLMFGFCLIQCLLWAQPFITLLEAAYGKAYWILCTCKVFIEIYYLHYEYVISCICQKINPNPKWSFSPLDMPSPQEQRYPLPFDQMKIPSQSQEGCEEELITIPKLDVCP